MLIRRNIKGLFLAGLILLGGCESGGFSGLSGSGSERRAESQANNGHHADSAGTYIGLASAAQGVERDRLTMLAVEQWLDAGDGRRAKSALRNVAKPSSGELLSLWNTAHAALLLFEGRPDAALAILDPMARRPLSTRQRARAEALRADAWFQKDEPSRAVNLYVQRETWLDRARDIERSRQRLWAGLLVSNPQSMRAAAEVSADPLVSGWLSLGALAASTGQQGIGWGSGIGRWQATHLDHPANSILSGMLLPQAGSLDFPRRIALLLPVTGRNSSAGKAIQNGFFGAYFAAAPALEDEQQVTVYDVTSGGVAAAYSQAVADGAEFVVGPLVRRSVKSLANQPIVPVPVLALNYLADDDIAPPGFYQFALSPEDEAASAALRALQDGAMNAVALYPNNDWGRRVMNSFATALERNGGRLLDHRNYQLNTQDFSIEIENLMALSQSVNRYNRLRANLGEPLQFDPRRRQDVDFIFLVADGADGRLIKSQLKFHYAGELPVYSTSRINAMDGRSNRDLNGVMFTDTPWVVSPPPWIADFPQLYNDFWPAERRMGHLHAMGYDAYHLMNSLFAAGGEPLQEMLGATGKLYLDEDGRIHRKPAWAQFRGGEPQALPDNSSIDELLDVPEQQEFDELKKTPTEWPIQNLNQ